MYKLASMGLLPTNTSDWETIDVPKVGLTLARGFSARVDRWADSTGGAWQVLETSVHSIGLATK